MTSTTRYAACAEPECPQRDKTTDYFGAIDITCAAASAARECVLEVAGYPLAPVITSKSNDLARRSDLRRDRPVRANMTQAQA